jgi:Xaa-Pro aminopeptidase
VVKAMLTPEEQAQLDAYHARVLAVIGPLAPPEVRAWLEDVCTPL